MKIIISGATGLIGSALYCSLKVNGQQIRRLVRQPSDLQETDLLWDGTSPINPSDLSGADAVIHLSGENLAKQRWTTDFKSRLWQSRILSTRAIVDALSRQETPPPTFICASAIGYYGDRGNDILSEESHPGLGFLSELCQAWEEEASKATAAGIRTISLRTGVVLTPTGGALKKMLLPFRLGLGGIVGNGEQFLSWISLEDAVEAISFCLSQQQLCGPINLVLPNPVTNRHFTQALAKKLQRPAFFPLPALAVKMLFGEMGESTLLTSTSVRPQRLLENRFSYRHPTIESYLEALSL